jgi:PAS domain S-box-containing protein
MKGLSSRFHLAMGLTSMVVSLLLLALFSGLVPDRDAAVVAGRASLAEAVAVSTSALINDDDADNRLQQVLGFIKQRNPQLLAIDVRNPDGGLRLHVGDGAAAPALAFAGASTDSHLSVPLLRDGQPWGHVSLVFAPLRDRADWASWVGSTPLLMAMMSLSSFVLFYFYLRRMLRHLDPSRVIPGRVRTAFDTLSEGLVVLDPRGRIVLANRAIVDVLGGDADKWVGRDAAKLGWARASQDGADAREWADLCNGSDAFRNVLMLLVDVDGKRRTFMVNGSPVPGAGGKAAGMLVSLDDVTELQEQEIQLRLARDQAEATTRAKSEFLANMSHEIRTPMNAILGFAELLRRGWQQDSRDAQRHLDTILGSGRHLLALINDILDLSKVEAGRLDMESVPCAVHEVVLEVVAIMRVRAEEKGVELAVEFPQALPATIRTDPARVRQIVTNLVGNALKFTAHGRVTVTMKLPLDVQPTRLAIDVADTGIGIAQDKIEGIFEPFVQAEASTTRQFGGTGLGLAISRKFARAMGGDVTASSVPGQGSTFHVTLDPGPLDDVPWLAPELLGSAHRVDASTSATRWEFGPARVLVVDDGPENRELVRLVLEASGLTVLEAENGAVALDVVALEKPDLVLMDVQMPVMDGFTATRALRDRGDALPVIALTANAMKGFERELEQAGFTGYLTKPVDIDSMLAALALRLGGRQVEVDAAPAESTTAEPAAPAAVDTGPIVSRLANHPRLSRVVRTFGKTLPVKLQAMQKALDAREMNELAELAHWLKGAGGTVGFDVFFEPARQFEIDARAGRMAELEVGLRELQAMALRVVVPNEDPKATAAAANAITPA